MNNNLFGVSLEKQSKNDILEKIIKHINNGDAFFHIVSINPENLVIASKNALFRDVLNQAQIRLNDGVGVVFAGRIMGINGLERIPGVEMMEMLLKVASEKRLTVVLIGGKAKIAEAVVDCQKSQGSKANFIALAGIADIKNPTDLELEKIFSIVADTKPHLIIVAFGSPQQELWLYENRYKMKGAVCMGVGGGFDFLSGRVPRAPELARRIGLEWLFRLILQPWRIYRQMRLIQFIWLIVKGKFNL